MIKALEWLYRILVFIFTAGFRYELKRLEKDRYDKKCDRCGTIRYVGIDECPRCYGLSNKDLIKLHIKQAEEADANKKIALIFLLLSLVIILAFLSYWLM